MRCGKGLFRPPYEKREAKAVCVVKAPKIKNPTPSQAEQDKPLPILRNPLLDGINPTTQGLRIGRDNLRLDLAPTAATAPSQLRIGGQSG